MQSLKMLCREIVTGDNAKDTVQSGSRSPGSGPAAGRGETDQHVRPSFGAPCPPGPPHPCSAGEPDSGCVCGAGGGFHLWFTSDKAPQWKGKIAGSGIGRSGARPPILSSPVAACLSLWYHRHNLNVAILTSARGTVRRRQLHS